MNADGSDQRPLTPGTRPLPARYSPGGTISEQRPVWSPTGKFLVFSLSESALGNDLAVVAADGSGYRRLTDTSEFESEPSFSPDGLSILFTFRGDLGPKPLGEPRESSGLYSLSLVDGQTRRVTLGPSQQFAARFSPSGRWISYVEDNAIWTMTADGRDRTRRTGRIFGSDPVQPVWSGPEYADRRWPGRRTGLPATGRRIPARDRAGGEAAGDRRARVPGIRPDAGLAPRDPHPPATAPARSRAPGAGARGRGRDPRHPAAARARPPAAASRRSLRYTAFDRSGISRLQASVERKRGKRCRYLTRKGLGKRRSCRKPAYFEVRRRTDWARRLGRLAPGGYRIRLRAWDARGNHVQRPRAESIRIRR